MSFEGTNAIILAAGRSKLCKALGYPKCLSNLGKESILERQVRLLKEIGIKEEAIHICVGFQREKIIIKTIKKYPNVEFLSVKWWWNEEQRHYGSFFSAWQIKHLWDNTIILYGDLVFSKEALLEMLNAPLFHYGFTLLLSDEKGTKWSPHEDFGIRMNPEGANYLKNLKEPLWLSINSNHPYPMHDMQIMGLWWHFEHKYGKKLHFTPNHYVQDVDWFEGLEVAKKRVREENGEA